MEQSVKFAENVMLIDASFLGFVIRDLKRHFERKLGRNLENIMLQDLFEFMALDAGIQPGAGRVQVFLIYDEEGAMLPFCQPSDLKKELNDTAFDCQLGKFEFNSFQPAGLAILDDLYLESLHLLVRSADVKKLLVVSFNESYGKSVIDVLSKVQGKNVTQLRMDAPESPVAFHWDFLAYPVMKALGIRGDELA